MDRILRVSVSPRDYQSNQACTYLYLPATPYEVMDVLDKLNLSSLSPEEIHYEIEEYHGFHCLSPYLIRNAGLIQLNALMEQLSTLDSEQAIAFCGLIKMEDRFLPTGIPFSRLMDYAHHTQDCLVIADVHSDEELGKFYCDNGFIDAVNDISDEAYRLLDFGKIGTEMRLAENGVYTNGCYIFQTEEIQHSDWTYELRKPEYSVRLELKNMANGKTTTLYLPSDPTSMDRCLDEIGAETWQGVSYICTDSRIPQLKDAITNIANVAIANRAAQMLDRISDEQLPKYKALLDAFQCEDLEAAADLLEELDDYVLTREMHSPEEVAMGRLKSLILDPDERSLLVESLDLDNYGNDIIDQGTAVMTEYGYFHRTDGEPIFAEPKQTGMDMQM